MFFVPLLLIGLALGAAGCATQHTNRRPEGDNPNDPCPGHDFCVCSEETGWIPGPPQFVGDHFVKVGDHVIDASRELYTAKKSGQFGMWRQLLVDTYFPQVNFEFELGSAKPKDATLFDRQTLHLTNELLKVILRKYSCVKEPFTNPFVVYVAGHTDRMGAEDYNLKLSTDRARKVAQGILGWLKVNSRQLLQPVRVEYIGLGESEAKANGDSDNTPNEKQRKVEVIAVTTGQPFEGDWKILEIVNPL